MKRLTAIFAALVLLATLTGCGGLEAAKDARDRCHDLGGRFEMWGSEGGGYDWACDLGDD